MSKYGILKELKNTGSCCPSQWEAITDKNEFIYIRYRFGRLTIHMSEPNGDLSDAINNGIRVLEKSIGNGLDGSLNEGELIKIIKENDLFET